MRTFTSAIVAIAALATSVRAGIYVTQPVATTVCNAGQACAVAWSDDGNSPALSAVGNCTVSVYIGSPQQQTLIFNINPSIDVSQNSQVSFSLDPTLGQSGHYYFIRFDSLALKDATNPANPYQGFSATFTMNGMTGTFTPAEQAQIAAISSAAPATTQPLAMTTTPGASQLATVVTAPKASGTSSLHAATTTAKKSGAVNVVVPGVISSLLGVTIFTAVAGVMLGLVALGL